MNKLVLDNVPFALEQKQIIDEELEILPVAQLFDHASQCADANCKIANCLKQRKKVKKSNENINKERENISSSQVGNDLSAKISSTMEKHKEVFFVIRLHSAQAVMSLPPVYTCNNCEANIETRYHCTVCDDYDLCLECYGKLSHPHEMKKLDYDDDDPLSDQKQTNPQELRRLSIKRCLQSLVHACQCRDANCRIDSCLKMKRVIQHGHSCNRKTNGGCPICKQLIALSCYHAKHCEEVKCPVPFCVSIQHKLKQQQIQDRIQQRQMLKRHAE